MRAHRIVGKCSRLQLGTVAILRRNPMENQAISVVSGQNPCEINLKWISVLFAFSKIERLPK